MFRFSWNGPRWLNDCFCFPGGNEAPWFSRFLPGFVSISPLEVGDPKGHMLKTSLDQRKRSPTMKKKMHLKWSSHVNLWRSRTNINILPVLCACRSHLWRPTYQKMETKYSAGLLDTSSRSIGFCVIWVCISSSSDCWRNGAGNPNVSFLETRNAQGGAFCVS